MTDCHVHIIPPDASLARYRRVMEALGITRTVVVQPTVYGQDNTVTLDAVAELGANGRAVGVFHEADLLTPAAVTSLDAAGMRGVRVNVNKSVRSDVREHLRALAERIAPVGWHIEVLIRRETLLDLADLLMDVPVPIVFAHFGVNDIAGGLGDPGFAAVRRFLSSGKGWMKLSGAYRVDAAPYERLAPFAQALAADNPERLLWGTDWPHPGAKGFTPEPKPLLDALEVWGLGTASLERIRHDNAATLYRF